MKIFKVYLVIFISAFFTTKDAVASNDGLWMGFRYSVSVLYIGIIEEGVDTPQPKSVQMPDFPIELMRAAASGDAEVTFEITHEGTVRDIRVEKTNAVQFGVSVENVVAKWTFFPGINRVSKQAISTHMRCKFEFKSSE